MMHPVYLALAAGAFTAAASGGPAASSVVAQVTPGDLRSLRAELVKVANSLWNSRGWSLDPEHAWVTLAAPLPEVGEVIIHPLFVASPEAPRMPLQFEIEAAGVDAPMRVGLAAALLHEECVARKRLIRGAPVSALDLSRQFLRWQGKPGSLPQTCEPGAGNIALRELSAGDRVRPADLGPAPAVMANSPVTVTVALNGVHVSTTGTALNDASDGEALSVRLQNPARVVKTRVVGNSLTIVESTP